MTQKGTTQSVVVFIMAFLVFTVVCPLSGDAAGEWVRAGGTHKYDAYVDMTTIAPTDQKVTLWTLKDFKIIKYLPRGSYRSMLVKKQFDCREGLSRLLRMKYYVGQMGKGRALYSSQGARRWSRVIPGSDAEKEWTIACQRR